MWSNPNPNVKLLCVSTNDQMIHFNVVLPYTSVLAWFWTSRLHKDSTEDFTLYYKPDYDQDRFAVFEWIIFGSTLNYHKWLLELRSSGSFSIEWINTWWQVDPIEIFLAVSDPARVYKLFIFDSIDTKMNFLYFIFRKFFSL